MHPPQQHPRVAESPPHRRRQQHQRRLLLKLLLAVGCWCCLARPAAGQLRHYAAKRRQFESSPSAAAAAAPYSPIGYRSGGGGGGGAPPQCQLEIACSGVNGRTPVRLPIQGPKGPPGERGPPGEKGMRGEPGRAGEPGKDAQQVPNVAFYAHLYNNTHQDPFTNEARSGDPIVRFEVVEMNSGGAYDPKTGLFTAPIAGIYQIYVKIAAQGQRTAAVHVMTGSGNQKRLLFPLWCQSVPDWGDTSNQILVRLRRGDTVWVQYRQYWSSEKTSVPVWYLHGYSYTAFSGHLIFPDE